VLVATLALASRTWRELAILALANAAVVALAVRGDTVVMLAAIAVLAIPGALFVVKRPQRGVLILAALVPFNGLLLIVPHPGVVAGWKEALTLATVAATFVSPPTSRASAPRKSPGWLAAVAGFLAIGVASAAVVGGARGLVGLKVSFFYLLVTAALWRCPFSRPERDLLVTILMADGLITALYGLAQEALGQVRLRHLGYQYNSAIRTAGGHLRAFSSFNQPFPFAFFLMIVLLIGLPEALREPGRLRNQLFLLATPVLGIALAATIVRAAWIGLAVGLVYLGLRKHWQLLLLVPLGLVALLLLPKGLSASALSSSSSQQRATGWRANVTRLETHPLGLGIGTTGSAAEKVAIGDPTQRATYQPDDYYIKTMLELGVPGLWLFLLFLGSALLNASATARRTGGADGAFALGVSAVVLASAVASTTATYFEIFPADVMFWLLLGAVAADPTAGRVLERAAPPAVAAASRYPD